MWVFFILFFLENSVFQFCRQALRYLITYRTKLRRKKKKKREVVIRQQVYTEKITLRIGKYNAIE